MKTCGIVLGALLATTLFVQAGFSASPPNTVELEGPPIERDTLKNDPEFRCKKIWDQMKEDKDQPAGGGTPNIVRDEKGGFHLVDDQDQRNTPANILAHIDDYRKMFWQTYPDKKYHEEAREAFAQALFLKDIHYLHSDLISKNFLQNTPFKDAKLHEDTPETKGNYAVGQAISGAAMDASINPDGGIAKTALLQYEAWVDATRKNLGLIKDLQTNDQLASMFKTDFGIVVPAYRKACDFGGKEYQAYLMERDWAEFTAAHRIPAAFDNKQYYGIFLYYRFGEFPVQDAIKTYNDMAVALDPDHPKEFVERLQTAADKVRNAPKTDTGLLITHAAEPYKLSPSGEKIPDYDMPVPPGVIDVYSNPLTALQKLVTDDDDYRYLVCITQDKYLVNRIPMKDQSPWAFSANAVQGLYKAFGKEEVLNAAHLVRTATKRFYKGTIIDPKAIGATRNYPFEAFEDILSRKNPKGYVLTALMFNANPESATTVDVDAAYKNLLATTAGGDEKKLLDDAGKMVLEKPNLASKNELDYIKKVLSGAMSLDKPAPGPQVADPDYLAWKNFPDNVKVSYVIRGWVPDRAHLGHFTGPSNPSIRYTLSVKSRTPDLIVLWDTEIVYDYPSGAAHPPHDSEIGYAATRSQSTAPVTARGKGRGTAPDRPTNAPSIAPTTESGEETLNVAGRSIPTHWTSTSRTSGSTGSGGKTTTTITKIWTSDEIPGGLVRKTEETIMTGGLANTDISQLRETVLESFQGFTPGTPAAAGALPPGGPAVAELTPATQPGANVPSVAPTAPIPTPTAPPAPAPKKTVSRERPTPAETAAQKEIMKRYYAAVTRDGQVRAKIDGNRRNNDPGIPNVPAEISKARTDVDTELSATLTALKARDNDEAQKQIQAAEDNLTLIEKFLNK